MQKSLRETWRQAAEIDPTLGISDRQWEALLRKRVRPDRYSRALMFASMARGKISLFADLPVPLIGRDGSTPREFLVSANRNGFPKSQRARTQTGPERSRRSLTMRELMSRWEGGEAVVGVTDLHFRGTRFARSVDPALLSDFNILAGSRSMQALEMMTAVISSAGNCTDSHSDDPDGSNHCFLGRKLWLAWDRFEGQARGLEDVTYDLVEDRAAFDMRTFLSLPSARWFVISDGQTLFCPGHLTHKVITLEHYLGLGSFHVALPSFHRSLTRWILHDPTDVREPLLREITAAVIAKMKGLPTASRRIRRQWGLDFMRPGMVNWMITGSGEHPGILERHPCFVDFASACERLFARQSRASGLRASPEAARS